MEQISDIFKAFSEDMRLRIFGLLADGREVCVCRFSEIFDSTVSKASRHLIYFKRNSIVIAIRKEQWMYYKINPEFEKNYSELFSAIKNLVNKSAQVKKDIEKLEELEKSENYPN